MWTKLIFVLAGIIALLVSAHLVFRPPPLKGRTVSQALQASADKHSAWATQELNDDTMIKEQLLELQMRYELEEISDEEFREREAELFARLRVIKMRQLDLMHEATAHTAESSSFVIEVGGDEER